MVIFYSPHSLHTHPALHTPTCCLNPAPRSRTHYRTLFGLKLTLVLFPVTLLPVYRSTSPLYIPSLTIITTTRHINRSFINARYTTFTIQTRSINLLDFQNNISSNTKITRAFASHSKKLETTRSTPTLTRPVHNC